MSGFFERKKLGMEGGEDVGIVLGGWGGRGGRGGGLMGGV